MNTINPDPDGIMTVAELLDHIEKNGYTQAYGTLIHWQGGQFSFNKEKVASACALGQGMLNADIKSVFAESDENSKTFQELIKRIAYMNDQKRLSPDQIAKRAREEWSTEELNMKLGYYSWNSKKQSKSLFSGR